MLSSCISPCSVQNRGERKVNRGGVMRLVQQLLSQIDLFRLLQDAVCWHQLRVRHKQCPGGRVGRPQLKKHPQADMPASQNWMGYWLILLLPNFWECLSFQLHLFILPLAFHFREFFKINRVCMTYAAHTDVQISGQEVLYLHFDHLMNICF